MFGRPETGLEALYTWMDQEQHRVADAKAGILGAILGGSWGLTGGALGVVLGATKAGPEWIPLIIAPALLATIISLVWFVRARSSEERALAKVRGEARGVLQRLSLARWTGKLRETLGEEASYMLNEAAKEWSRCRSALDSPVLKATGADSPWRRARDNGLRAMDAAMARMVLLAGSGTVGTRGSGAGASLLAEMQQMAGEAGKLAERLAGRMGVRSGDASSDLRRTIGELKMLADADDEFERLIQDA